MQSLINKFLIMILVFVLCHTQNIEFKPVRDLPPDMPTCKDRKVNLSDCLKFLYEQMLPRIRDGIPELNIPALDPFVLPKTAYQFSQGIVQGRMGLKNVVVSGLSTLELKNIDVKSRENHMKMKSTSYIQNLYIEGDYKANMKVNELKLSPKGRFNITMNDVTMITLAEGDLFERDGHSFLKLSKFNIVPDVGGMKIFASGLSPDPTLSDVILDFANQYWRTIYRSLFTETRSRWEPQILNATNQFFDALPIDLFI